MTQPPLTEKAVLITDLQLGRSMQLTLLHATLAYPCLDQNLMDLYCIQSFPGQLYCVSQITISKKNIQVHFCQFSKQTSNMILQKPTEGQLVNDLIGSNASSIIENKIAITNRDTRSSTCGYCMVTNLHKMKQYNIGL